MKHIWTVCIVVLLAPAAPVATAGVYTITDLGTLGGASSLAFGINNLGQVVGDSMTATGQTHAFLYTGGTMTDLGVVSAGENYSTATRINDLGQVVGYSGVQDNTGYVSNDLPFLYANGAMINIGSLGGVYGMANDINNSGQFVGISDATNGAFLDSNGSVTSLGHFASSYIFSDAFGVNDLGQVTGYSTTGSGPGFEHPFLYSSGTFTDLGTLGGNSARAFDINNAGTVVGASFTATNNAEHAFVYSNGQMQDLGALDAISSQALAINNTGAIVGTLVFDPTGTQNHGFLYQNGTMVDVNSLLPANSGWVLRDAQDINDRGQIVGFGEINGQDHAYLLTPVPEPAALTIWATLFLSWLAKCLVLSKRLRRCHVRRLAL